MKYILTIEDESFGDKKLSVEMPLSGSETMEQAVSVFKDCINVLRGAIADERKYPIISNRIDGEPSPEQREFVNKYGRP